MARSPSTMTHMWMSPGRWGSRCPPTSLRSTSVRDTGVVWSVLVMTRPSVQGWGVGGFELGCLLEEHDHAGQPYPEDHRAHPEGDGAVPREGTGLRDEHGDGQDLGDDLPHADVGQPLGEDLVPVVQD